MSEKGDNFANNLQGQIFDEIKESYGEKAYLRSLDPLYMGSLKDPDEDQHCAFLAAASLYEALNDYMIKMTRGRKT